MQWVEDWINTTAAAFPQVRFILDEYQLLGVIQRYSSVYDIRRFDFASGRGNHALTLTLRNLILHRQVKWFPGCGQLPTSDERDDLVTELGSLLLRISSGGRVRIDHRREAGCHDDRAFALGAACLELVRDSAGPDWLDVTLPGFDGGFAW